MRYLLILCVLMANQAFAQSETTRELKTSIKNVTVFLQGAQIFRDGNINLKKGRSTLEVVSLSPNIDAKSIQVKGKGVFTILSVNHAFNFLDELGYNEKVDSLIKITKELQNKIAICNSRISVLKEKQSLLNANKTLGHETATTSISELKLAVDFYDKALMDILTEQMQLNNKIDDHNEHLTKLRNQIQDYQNHAGEPTSEIEIAIKADQNTSASFTLTYLVTNAGWHPGYDLRVKDVEHPLELTYQADVYQNTGVDWNNVKLTFSNGNPNQSGVAPELNTWFLNYQRNTSYNRTIHGINSGNIQSVSGIVLDENGAPAPDVNVLVKGSSIGTVTDTQGRYSLTLPNDATSLTFSSVGYANVQKPISNSKMNISLIPDIAQLDEIVVTAMGSSRNSSSARSKLHDKKETAEPVITTTVENQTTVEFEVETPYTIVSRGENLTVDLNTYKIETIYEYYAVPKLDKDAFLIARIINWNQFDLLEGEANLYFEDAYVGRSVLNAKAFTDTLDISLGRDRNIVIGREKVDTFTKRTSLGSNKIDTRGFNIFARNKKSQPIHLTIFDQIPVPAINTIEVNTRNISKGHLDERTGEILWVLDIAPQNQIELELVYEVKYPKRERVDLE